MPFWRNISSIPPAGTTTKADLSHRPLEYRLVAIEMPTLIPAEVPARQPEFMSSSFAVPRVDVGYWRMQEQTEQVVDALMSHLEKYRLRKTTRLCAPGLWLSPPAARARRPTRSPTPWIRA